MPRNSPPLAAALACLRAAAGWRQAELAAAARLPPSVISDYERGHKPLSLARLRHLAAVMKLDSGAIDQAIAFVAEVLRGRDDFGLLGALHDVEQVRHGLVPARRSEGRRGPAGGTASLPEDAPSRQRLITQLRLLHGWTKKQLGEAAGIAASSISDYERGARVPTLRTMDRLVAAVRASPAQLAQIHAFVSALHQPPADGQTLVPGRPDAAAMPRSPIEVRPPDPERERQEAAEVWSRLRQRPVAELRAALERDPAGALSSAASGASPATGASWALSERICVESVQQAIEKPHAALPFADLAWRMAQLCGGPRDWQARLIGYARAHRANARRVLGDLQGASAEMEAAKRLWCADGARTAWLGGGEGPLDGAKLASFETSLLTVSGQPERVLAAVDEALKARPTERTALLIHRVWAFSDLGRHRQAIRASRELMDGLGPHTAPRLEACVRMAVVKVLLAAGHFCAAQPILSEVNHAVLRLGGEMDLLRFDVYQAKVAAGLRDLPRAIELADGVYQGFAARKLAWHAAWAGALLSALLLRSGRAVEAKVIRRQAAPVLLDAGIARPLVDRAFAGTRRGWTRLAIG